MVAGGSAVVDWAKDRSSGSSAAFTPTSSVSMPSGCRRPALTHPVSYSSMLLRPVSTLPTCAMASPPTHPTMRDLPYDIKQSAIFGEASYDFGQFKLTAGGRYYNFKEKRDFISGGIFANGDTRIGDKTKSNGFSPRVIATLGAKPQPQRQPSGSQGLPPRRHQRSAQPATLQCRRPGRLRSVPVRGL